MNAQRRKAIDAITDKLLELKEELESLRDEEQECYDNLPESLQYSERGEAMEENVSDLDEACDELDTVISNLADLIER